jgi:hypothetical protein
VSGSKFIVRANGVLDRFSPWGKDGHPRPECQVVTVVIVSTLVVEYTWLSGKLLSRFIKENIAIHGRVMLKAQLHVVHYEVH